MKTTVLTFFLMLTLYLSAGDSPYLGVFLDEQPGFDGGVLIDEVIPQSPAAKAGILAGDTIMKINDLSITDGEILREIILNHKIGDYIRVEVASGNDRNIMDIVLEERNDNFLPDISIFNTKTRHLGLKLQRLTDQLKSYFGVNNGVLVAEVIADTPAEQAGIKAGDIIVSVSEQKIDCSEDVLSILQRKNPGDQIILQISRANQHMSVEVEVAETESLISLDIDSKIIFLGKDQVVDISDLHKWFSSVIPDTTHKSIERQLEKLQSDIDKLRKRLLTK